MLDIHNLSLSVLSQLEDAEVEVPLGTVALALSFGRVASPVMLTGPQEIAWLEALMSFTTSYFHGGTVN